MAERRTLFVWPPRGWHVRPNSIQAGLHYGPPNHGLRRVRSTRNQGGPGYIITVGRFMAVVTWGKWEA